MALVQLSMHVFMAWDRWSSEWRVMWISCFIADENRRARYTAP
jgi:hypothetical protein